MREALTEQLTAVATLMAVLPAARSASHGATWSSSLHARPTPVPGRQLLEHLCPHLPFPAASC